MHGDVRSWWSLAIRDLKKMGPEIQRGKATFPKGKDETSLYPRVLLKRGYGINNAYLRLSPETKIVSKSVVLLAFLPLYRQAVEFLA